jgi:bilirubin oxidase
MAAPLASRQFMNMIASTTISSLLNPTTIPKYVTALKQLPVMPTAGSTSAVDLYEIAIRRFRQQILPSSLPSTNVFGYGSARDSSTFSYPSRTIEARANRPVRVKWINQLVDSSGNFLPHLLPIDPTLHWANPPGGIDGRDSHPTFTSTPGPYRGPVPIVTHLHGAHVTEESDGYPEAWYLPVARNIPAGFARVGSFYDRFRAESAGRTGVLWEPGSASFQYPNDQRATGLWFHSHELGLTRVNLYSGLSGFYLIRGGASDLPAGVLPGPAPRAGEPAGTRHFEIPLMIQDKTFNSDGSLFFPPSRGFFGDVPPEGPFVPDSDVPPIWNPEFFGTTMLVNGNTWPTLTTEARRYRFRVVNSCNTRVLMLRVVSDPLAARPATSALPIWVIGTDGGFLPAPVQASRITLAPAERADIIVDFTGVRPGTQLFLINEGPDEPFGGGEPDNDFTVSDPATTGQVMRFTVVPATSRDTSVPPAQLTLPPLRRLGAATVVRQVSLNELSSATFDAPIIGMLGAVTPANEGAPMHWDDPVSETPRVNTTEIWELHNFTEDGHPIHLHQSQFEVVNRQPFDGAPRPPEPTEVGNKDTIVALPSETTRLKVRFDITGRFVWHCHIIDHEDNEMMRPIQVLP